MPSWRERRDDVRRKARDDAGHEHRLIPPHGGVVAEAEMVEPDHPTGTVQHRRPGTPAQRVTDVIEVLIRAAGLDPGNADTVRPTPLLRHRLGSATGMLDDEQRIAVLAARRRPRSLQAEDAEIVAGPPR